MLHPVLQVFVSLIATEAAELHRLPADQEAPRARLSEAQHQSQLADEFGIYDGRKRTLSGCRARRAAAGDKSFSEGGEGAPFGGGQDLLRDWGPLRRSHSAYSRRVRARVADEGRLLRYDHSRWRVAKR